MRMKSVFTWCGQIKFFLKKKYYLCRYLMAFKGKKFTENNMFLVLHLTDGMLDNNYTIIHRTLPCEIYSY